MFKYALKIFNFEFVYITKQICIESDFSYLFSEYKYANIITFCVYFNILLFYISNCVIGIIIMTDLYV